MFKANLIFKDFFKTVLYIQVLLKHVLTLLFTQVPIQGSKYQKG